MIKNINIFGNGLVVIEPTVYKDDRGYFMESFSKREYDKMLSEKFDFVQENQSYSKKGVIRGLHFQKPPHDQAKLVRVCKGIVLDVALDIRKGSPTYGKWYGVVLSDKNFRQFLIPRGFAHGFSVLSDEAIFQYKCDNYYNKASEGGIFLNDETLAIDWEVDEQIISDKDRQWGPFADFESPFEYNLKEIYERHHGEN